MNVEKMHITYNNCKNKFENNICKYYFL